MIKINYTERLFYKQYDTKVVIEIRTASTRVWPARCPELTTLAEWVRDHLPSNSYKVTNRWHSHAPKGGNIWHTVIYVKDANHRDIILNHFGAQVISVTQPANNSHKDELDPFNITVARNTLIYKKFRYVVHFKYMGDQTVTLERWLCNYFKDQDSNTYKFVFDWWSVKLYLAEQGDMATVKLSWHDQIQCIKTVMLVP
jgi:hypothetical protein